MSDDITAAIESSIADLPGSEASGGDDSNPSPDPSPSPSSTPTPPPDPASVPAQSSTPLPVEAQTPQMQVEEKPKRRGPIPFDRHEAALANARAETAKAVEAARIERAQELHQARQELEAKQRLIQLADTDPDQFLEALARVDPRYAERLGRKEAAQQARQGNGHGPTPGKPGPDRQFADGTVGYSEEAIEQLFDWHASQVESRIAQRYAEIEQSHQAQRAVQGAVQRVSAQLDDAKTWPGFLDAQPDIAKALRANRALSLEAAYRQVVFPKMKADRDSMRAELIAEMNGKPKHVTGTTPANAPATATSDDIESIIRASIANIPR